MLAPLCGKRVRVCGRISVVKNRSKYRRFHRYNTSYQVTLTDVFIDQVRDPIDHINLRISSGEFNDEVLNDFKRKKFTHMSFTALVKPYKKKNSKTGLWVDNYGLVSYKKRTFLRKS